MDLKEKMNKFNQRWNIDSEETPAEAFAKFKTRVLNDCSDIDRNVDDSEVALFCRFLGIMENWHATLRDKWGNHIITSLTQETNEIEFYKILELIFSLRIYSKSSYSGVTYNKKILLDRIRQSINFSNINLAVVEAKDGEIIFYPRGEEFLDAQLVNNVLSFLEGKPELHFREALHSYSDKKWIKSAESLRRSIEEYLRMKFSNSAGLQANLIELSKRLKDNNNPAQARNIVFSGMYPIN